MRIGIIYTPDPVIMNDFIYKIVNQLSNEIIVVIEDDKKPAGKKTFYENLKYKIALLKEVLLALYIG